MKTVFLICALLLATGCHRKPHYRIWGTSDSRGLKSMKKNPFFWDCAEYKNGPWCKECMNEWTLELVSPKLCQPESEHQ